MSGGKDQLRAAEARARAPIDQQLARAGWRVQDKKDLNVFAGQGISVREAVMKPGSGRAGYLLHVAVAGVIEAKRVGTTLSEVWLSTMDSERLPADAWVRDSDADVTSRPAKKGAR